MKNIFGFLLLVSLSAVKAEIVYLEDNNAKAHKRTFDDGLDETLDFNLRYAGDLVSLKLRENKRLNANAPIYEEVTLEDGTKKIQRNINIPSNKDVRYYQDTSKGAYMSAECVKRKNGPCTRHLTGNLYHKGKEYTLEPVKDEKNDKRELNSNLGTPHKMELLPVATRKTEIKKNTDGEETVESVRVVPGDKYSDDFEIYTPDSEATTAPTTTEDYGETREQMEHEKRVANDYLLEKLLQRLAHNRQKRNVVAHGIEMLFVIDHMVYNDFARRYSGDETIKYKIREYYTHIVNGIDIRYASIQEADMSIYVVISGFFISNDVSQSPWMSYNENPTNGGQGLSNMISWRQRDNLPEHDHACLITGTNIQSNGNDGVVGIAYLNGVCRDNRVSINEEMGFFQGAGVLAHELGHNLGAPHDNGTASSACDPEAFYLMAPYVAYVDAGSTNTEPWRFSRCSIQSFRDYFAELAGQSNDCTLNRGVIYDQDEYDMHNQSLPGQLYSVTQQCELLTGAGAAFCGSNQNTADICRNLRCQKQNGGCDKYVAAHGTPCGNSKLCFRGLCSEPAGPTVAPPTNTPGCDRTFTSETGTIESPNHPSLYPNNQECVYKINRPAGETIKISFQAFDVEASGCQYDYLEVRNGNGPNAPLMGTFCGTQIPSELTSSGNSLYLRFKTDDSVQGSGFKLSYEKITGGPNPEICDATFTDETGTIQSPSYPNLYPNNRECVYNINRPAGERIKISFQSFDVEADGCQYDYLEIRNGNGPNAPLVGTYCGTQVPADITSSGNSLYLKFITDGSVQGTGFRLTYERISGGPGPNECGGTFTAKSGHIESPNHPNQYPNNKECVYKIEHEVGERIKLSFSAFDVEADGCQYDYLEIRNGNGPNAPLMGKYCGTQIPPDMISTGHTLYLRFKTDYSVQGTGFKLSFESIDSGSGPNDCGTFTDVSGLIISPNYPNLYPNNRECVYKINRNEGERIQLKFNSFNVEASGCQYDYLEIRNGGSPNAPLMGTYCGTQIPPNMLSTGNSMYLRFKTDETVQGTGFELLYETVAGLGPDGPNGTDTYVCENTGVLNNTCEEIKTLMGNPVKMCVNFFGQCCQYCYEKNACKKDKVVKGASKFKCNNLVASLGLETTCAMFPYHCCKTCKDLATGSRR